MKLINLIINTPILIPLSKNLIPKNKIVILIIPVVNFIKLSILKKKINKFLLILINRLVLLKMAVVLIIIKSTNFLY